MSLNNYVIFRNPKARIKTYEGKLIDLFKNTSLPAKEGLEGAVILIQIDNVTAAKVKMLIPKECKMESFLQNHPLVNGQKYIWGVVHG